MYTLVSYQDTESPSILKIQYASDLHLEFALNKAYIEKYPIEPIADILILGGDITYLTKRMLSDPLFDLWSDQFKDVYIIAGNHEFYNKHYPIENIFNSMEKKVRDNIRYLNNKTIIIDNIRFIFTTLFTSISAEQEFNIRRGLADFHLCRYNANSNLSLTIKEYNESHSKCRAFLEETLKQGFEGKTVIVSHHVPYPKTFIKDYPQFTFDLSEAFHVDLTGLVRKYKIDHWISGHTHINHDSIQVERTWFHTNQLGYVEAGEYKKFRRKATIEL